MMKRITAKEFEELITGDASLTARLEAITGGSEERKDKIIAFAASLGYELDFGSKPEELTANGMESVTGGARRASKPYHTSACAHKYVEVSREKGRIFDTVLYKCSKCGKESTRNWVLPWD